MDVLMQWLEYQRDQPLIFTQFAFWVFFALVLVGYSFVYPHRGPRNAYLFLISLFFYYKTSGLFVLLLLFSTLADYAIGLRMGRTTVVVHRKWWLALSLVLNLVVLVYFKYAYFFTDTYNALMATDHQVYNHLAQWSNGFFGTQFRADKILLPVGISFFTFQTMSYAIDVYRKDIAPVTNVLDFGFYVSFFPQLVAGPIVRASAFIPQLYQPYQLSREVFGMALFWILNGLIKKMFLADYLAVNFIDRVFANPGSYSGFENLAALFGYSLQVYADFSGYTDMAIGIALLLGFTLPVNFNSPYKAQNVAEFWKRWHISLSNWLKDYLYIPMGGNRQGSLFSYIMVGVVLVFVWMFLGTWTALLVVVGSVAMVWLVYRLMPSLRRHVDTNINLMLTMTIGGLWHGASWNMIIWGAMNGLGLVCYKYVRRIMPAARSEGWYWKPMNVAVTLTFITFTRTWFRGETLESASLMLRRIFTAFHPALVPEVVQSYATVFGMMLFGYLIHWLPGSWKAELRQHLARAPLVVQAIVSLVVIVFVYQVLTSDLQPFIYFIF